jgi:hypothetical protein
MNPASDQKFKEWEDRIRELVRYAEEKRLLGCAECAKALLLYGMKVHSDAVAADLHHIDFDAFTDELKRRGALVRKTCTSDKPEAK